VQDRYFQKWEFPGGKLEPGETAAQALQREFEEEIGVIIDSCQPLMQLDHDYSDRHVRLHVQTISAYRGKVRAMEGQALKWVTLQALGVIWISCKAIERLLKRLKPTLSLIDQFSNIYI